MTAVRTGGSARVASPRFSIVTPSFNQAEYLAETLASVAAQRRDDVEHIVIDGGSTDGSVALLEAHDASLAYWQSGPDAGQPAAINIGLRRARGEIVAFLNSDDVYLPGALDEIARLADAHPDAGWLIGGTLYFGEGGGNLWYEGRAPQVPSDVLYYGVYVPQQGQFWRRDAAARLGGFDEGLEYSFDLDFSVRCMLEDVRTVATTRPVAGFRFHSASKTMGLREKQDADTREVERRHLPRVVALEGAAARRARARHHGNLALEAARLDGAAGRRSEGWRRVLGVAREYPSAIPSRAFAGTVQRLLGLRAP